MKKFVLAIAMIGMGSFAMAQQAPQDKKFNREEMKQKMQEKEQERMAEMKKELNLNQSQIAQIKGLHEKRKSEMVNNFEKNKEQRQAKMAEMKAKRQQMDNEMKNILTPEQYAKWEAGKKAKMEQRRAMMKEKGMKGDRKMKHGFKTAPQQMN
ncbi:DUF342 domain-containing protein [Chryseobacterium aquaeductus]|nr:DUF342 domain-containing protein [Chryseobacterium aquaeductus]